MCDITMKEGSATPSAVHADPRSLCASPGDEELLLLPQLEEGDEPDVAPS